MKRRLRKRHKRPCRRRLLLHENRLNRLGYFRIAGVDEAGCGPLAGPVVAAAVILKKRHFKEEINDSKQLSPEKRLRAYREIIKNAVFGVGIVDEKIIDEINIHAATIKAMELALSNLGVLPDYILIDGRVKLKSASPTEAIVMGDSKSLSIAAASIIAKVTRDNLMINYDLAYPRYGFARHKGYATKAHKLALKNHGPSPIHRFSFQPVKDSILY
ncbi:MAG: ribonuclease HII [Omnitrophica bacterium RIFCSPLOWO2_01_FULL_45_10]|nr:MAG: ribonuclease HII [Omnitrophica bacterium RIFCSPLOWO2_01_FULL_45_10]